MQTRLSLIQIVQRSEHAWLVRYALRPTFLRRPVVGHQQD